MPPAQTTTAANGWPTTEGPLRTLAELGLIPDPQAAIPWLRAPTWQQTDKGQSWKFKPLFLHHDALWALAALALEGYNVHVSPDCSPQNLQVTIRDSGGN